MLVAGEVDILNIKKIELYDIIMFEFFMASYVRILKYVL
jgi:hypothetical protein